MRIAVVAHDGKKADMVSFVMKRLKFFKRIDVEFVNDKSVYKFFLKKYYSEKKKNIESSYEIIFDKKQD